MKRNTIACALTLMMSAAASAQTTANSVQIYGIIDVGVEHISTSRGATTPAASLTSVVNGPNSLSRFGFRGTEDIGNGLSANFQLESGFDSVTGAQSASALFNRSSWVGLKGNWGEFRAGRT